MKPTGVTELHLACERFNVAFFFKQWGGTHAKSGGRLLEGEEWEWNGFLWQIVPQVILSRLLPSTLRGDDNVQATRAHYTNTTIKKDKPLQEDECRNLKAEICCLYLKEGHRRIKAAH